MIGTITSKISQYVSPGQNKEAGEKKTVPPEQKPVESPQVPASDSFSVENKIAKPSSDPAGSKEFVGVQSSLAQEVTGSQSGGTAREYSAELKTEGAPVEKPGAPMDRNKSVDIIGNTPEAQSRRVELLRNTPQVNKTNGKDGEGMCGGASLASAMVLDSGKSPEAAKKNAEAIRSVYAERCKGKKLTPEQDEALKHLADGKLSVKDSEQLQKVMYGITQNVHGQGEGGVNVDGMAETVNMLRAKGGFAGKSNVTFHLNEGGTSRTGGKHWTTTVDNTHVDTWPTNYSTDKPNNGPHYAVVTGKNQGIGQGNNGWVGEVTVPGDGNTKMSFDPTNGSNDRGLKNPVTVEFDQNKYNGKSLQEIFEFDVTGKDIEKAMDKQKSREVYDARMEQAGKEWKKMEKEDFNKFIEVTTGSRKEEYDEYLKWKHSRNNP